MMIPVCCVSAAMANRTMWARLMVSYPGQRGRWGMVLCLFPSTSPWPLACAVGGVPPHAWATPAPLFLLILAGGKRHIHIVAAHGDRIGRHGRGFGKVGTDP